MEYVKTASNYIASSNFSGALDIICVKKNDGSILSTPFYVRFGKLKLGLVRPNNKIVTIKVNGTVVNGTDMKLDCSGEAGFDHSQRCSVASLSQAKQRIKTCEPVRNQFQHLSLQRDIEEFLGLEFESSSEYTYRRKRLLPASQTLQKFKLNFGRNKVEFSVNLGGKSVSLESELYLYKETAKFVVVSLDTLKGSNGVGGLLPGFGQSELSPGFTGVSNLFKKISRNGYEILYVADRAIRQSQSSKAFIREFAQDGVRLPAGPLLLSPNRSMAHLANQLLFKSTSQVKEASLRSLTSIFPKSRNPFYAAFCKHDSEDVNLYLDISVSKSRIFHLEGEKSMSCIEIMEMVHSLFPQPGARLCGKFNHFQYWSMPYKQEISGRC
mmetsp:Transcript_3448/g.4129  ORF Transcript_3448/g.4129 Transcript_3448/m.4129 type:complete len:382 (+) Transcript_3448:188-1333(+)